MGESITWNQWIVHPEGGAQDEASIQCRSSNLDRMNSEIPFEDFTDDLLTN